MSSGKTMYQTIGIVAAIALGFLAIPPILKICGNKLYKYSLKKDKVDFENMGPEIVRKEKQKGK